MRSRLLLIRRAWLNTDRLYSAGLVRVAQLASPQTYDNGLHRSAAPVRGRGGGGEEAPRIAIVNIASWEEARKSGPGKVKVYGPFAILCLF
jgi:hypothetical protein